MLNRCLVQTLAWVTLSWLAGAAGARAKEETPVTTCENEGKAFWMWSFIAGSDQSAKLIKRNSAVTRVVTVTRDGQKLQGLKLASARTPATAAVLVIQGNAMLASDLIERMEPLRQAGADVYMYDFRGYGRSEGTRRIAAITVDYREILEKLVISYSQVSAYVLSFGGILLLNSGFDLARLHGVVLDAVPSTLEPFECTVNYAPVSHLPSECRQFVAHASRQDPTLDESRLRALMEAVKSCGGRTIWRDAPYHPFDGEPEEQLNGRLTTLVGELALAKEAP